MKRSKRRKSDKSHYTVPVIKNKTNLMEQEASNVQRVCGYISFLCAVLLAGMGQYWTLWWRLILLFAIVVLCYIISRHDPEKINYRQIVSLLFMSKFISSKKN